VIVFEALSDRHDLSRFRSGAGYLDHYLQNQALAEMHSDLARTFVAIDAEGNPARPIGYFTLKATGQYVPPIEGIEDASDAWLHMAELAFLARDESWRGTGLGGILLVEALCYVEEAARRIGLPGVFLYATSEGIKLYEAYGFRRLSEQTKAFYLPLREVKSILVETTNDQ
jgi:GNAT superfamily N-acetyltransferase